MLVQGLADEHVRIGDGLCLSSQGHSLSSFGAVLVAR